MANSAGDWAGYAAEARYALDGDISTYWSSTGGAVRACASGCGYASHRKAFRAAIGRPVCGSADAAPRRLPVRAPQVCCTESSPGWLLVSLGAVRPLASLQVLVDQDMTYTLALSNASGGPFAVVARHTCEV